MDPTGTLILAPPVRLYAVRRSPRGRHPKQTKRRQRHDICFRTVVTASVSASV
eukprot:COSAG02_NODE_33674_length_496_cov_1.284635_1_plen_52_part_10